MSSQYRQENRNFVKSMYEPETQVTKYHCNGSCTCDLGYRTQYDLNQYQRTIDGKTPDYPVAVLTGWIPN